ncbi:MAG: RNA polymerase sigma-70 factor [Sphingobacterium sp.]|jgi:RNA polymerase sigma-70 factor (ECF subfamily)|nr:RNA polymerase sigma-70 factor [Sphingobacterium sp.]
MDLKNTDKESALILRVQQDDRDAFAALYYMHISKLKIFVQRTAKSPFLTEDIVHDTFVKIWEKRKDIDPNKSFKSFLFTVAKNNLLNLLKRAQYESNIITEISRFATIADHSTDQTIGFNESSAIVAEALEQLHGNVKEVFVLCRLQGLSYKQAAEILGITTSTVNKHMHKALKHVRDYITAKNLLVIILLSISRL